MEESSGKKPSKTRNSFDKAEDYTAIEHIVEVHRDHPRINKH